MRSRMTTLTTSLLVVLAACSERGVTPARVVAPEEAQLARPSGPTDPVATFYFPLADASLGLKSDGRYGDGTYSVYANGVCGLSAKLFATTEKSNSGDATMQTNNPRAKDNRCTERSVTVDYGDGVVWSGATFINVRQIQNTSYSIPVGSAALRDMAMSTERCGGLRWMPVLQPEGIMTGADQVLVTRVDASTWRVQSQPYPNDKAYCLNTGQLYNIAVDFLIVSSYPLP